MTCAHRLSLGQVALSVPECIDPTGRFKVVGVILGPLSVTPCLDRGLEYDRGWHITHVETGLKLDPETPFKWQSEAVAAMRALLQVDGEWNVSTWDAAYIYKVRSLTTEICAMGEKVPLRGVSLK